MSNVTSDVYKIHLAIPDYSSVAVSLIPIDKIDDPSYRFLSAKTFNTKQEANDFLMELIATGFPYSAKTKLGAAIVKYLESVTPLTCEVNALDPKDDYSFDDYLESLPDRPTEPTIT
jgi:hypothetical protein